MSDVCPDRTAGLGAGSNSGTDQRLRRAKVPLVVRSWRRASSETARVEAGLAASIPQLWVERVLSGTLHARLVLPMPPTLAEAVESMTTSESITSADAVRS